MYRRIILLLTLLLSGRAMTLLFIHRVGGEQLGDPPQAWLMPLIGDAVIGLTALIIAYLVANKRGLWVWASVIAWNVVAIWDALSAFIIHLSNPWPEFFMIKLFGPAMFFAAVAMHAVILVLLCKPEVRQHYLNYVQQTMPGSNASLENT